MPCSSHSDSGLKKIESKKHLETIEYKLGGFRHCIPFLSLRRVHLEFMGQTVLVTNNPLGLAPRIKTQVSQ
jgi:hypothetical protein